MPAEGASLQELLAEGDVEPYVFAHLGVGGAVAQKRRRVAAAGTDVDYTGDMVWPTGIVFCRYLCEHKALLEGRRVLDLGAGTGLVGLVVAKLGAHVTLVDVPRVVPLLAANASAEVSAPAGGRTYDVEVRPLWWGDAPATERLVAERGPFDVVLCCEVVYQQPEEVLKALLRTLEALVAQPAGRLVFAYQQRDGAEYSDALFFKSLTSVGGFQLVSEEPLVHWDDSWDDTPCRWVRTYAWSADKGGLRPTIALL